MIPSEKKKKRWKKRKQETRIFYYIKNINNKNKLMRVYIIKNNRRLIKFKKIS